MENMRRNLIVNITSFTKLNFVSFFLSVTGCQSDADLARSNHVTTVKSVSDFMCQGCYFIY
jgi:hypothetical protein